MIANSEPEKNWYENVPFVRRPSRQKPLVSIGVTTYNMQDKIGETIDSLVNQRGVDPREFEVVFVDDSSKDDTVGVLDWNMSRLGNARVVVNNQNKGAYASKNRALEESEAPLLMIIDGDDLYCENTVAETLKFMGKNPGIKYSYSKHMRIDEDSNITVFRPSYDFSRESLLHMNYVVAVESFYRDIFNEIGGFDDVHVEDYDFVLRASEVLRDNQFGLNPMFLYKYRDTNGSKSDEVSVSRTSGCKVIEGSLSRLEGISKDVFSVGRRGPAGHTYYVHSREAADASFEEERERNYALDVSRARPKYSRARA
jgi:glycosyltransferase involved in cell wall biosynthesis